ncbi:MAG: hypothetical protein ABEI11_00350 [Haloarculaceae archaeon]
MPSSSRATIFTRLSPNSRASISSTSNSFAVADLFAGPALVMLPSFSSTIRSSTLR